MQAEPTAQGKIYGAADAPVDVTIGRHSYFATPPQLLAYAEGRHVEIGSFCSISGDVRFYLDGGHRMDFITTCAFHTMGLHSPPGHNASKGPITIGHDVWIGHGVSVLSGVTIGTGAVVGTRAVVAADVRPYAIVVGNPAREIRRRFDDEECELLLASRWWEWSDEKIRSALGDLWATDVRGFVDRWADVLFEQAAEPAVLHHLAVRLAVRAIAHHVILVEARPRAARRSAGMAHRCGDGR